MQSLRGILRKASLELPKVAVFRYHGLPVTLTKESVPSSRRRARRDIIKESPAQDAEPFAADEMRVSQLGITARELEVLGLIATGLSNR